MSDLRGDRNMRPVPGESAGPGLRSPKRLITAGIALGAVAAFGIGIWFAYDQGVKRGASGAPPLIRADQSPAKIAPENPGGMQVPNQDKQIYERLPGNSTQAPAAGQTEKLLPPPERPSAAPTSPAVTVPNRSAQSVPNQTPATPPATSAVPNRTPPNQTDAPSAAPITPATPGQPQPVTPPRTAATPPAPAATPAPAAAPAARTVTATAGGSAKIQLASLKDQAAATATWTALQKKFPAELGGLQPSYERVEIADKGTFIRLQAGPLKDRADAQAACSALAAKNQGCIVVGR
jgi:cell division septation protein DedD